MERLCPACTCLLSRESKGQFHLDACPDCGGVWLEAAQTRKLAEKKSTVLLELSRTAASNAKAKPETHVARRCPDCDKPLSAERVKDALDIDVCKPHGTWFDAEELVQFVEGPKKPAKTSSGDKVVAVADVLQIVGGILEILSAF